MAKKVKENGASRYSVVIDEDLAFKIQIIAKAQQSSGPDWVNNHLRPIVEGVFPQIVKGLGEQGRAGRS